MSEDLTNVLEAKLYEATDQFSTLSGIAGARSDEASVVQSAEDDTSAVSGSETSQNPASVAVSGATSSAPGRGQGQSIGDNDAADPVAGASANASASGAQQRATDPAQQAALPGEDALSLDAADGDGPLAQFANLLNDDGAGAGADGETPPPGDPALVDDPDGSGDPDLADDPDGGPGTDASDGAGDDDGPGDAGDGDGDGSGDGGGPGGSGDGSGGGPGPGGLEDDIDLVLDTRVDLPLVGPVAADVDVILDPIETLLGEDIDIEIGTGINIDGPLPVVDQVLGALPDGLLGSGPDQAGDTDITVDLLADLGIGAPIIADVDVTLDAVESLLGTDIDLDVDAILDGGSLSGVVDGVTGALGGGLQGSLLDSLVGDDGGLLGDPLTTVGGATGSLLDTLVDTTGNLLGGGNPLGASGLLGDGGLLGSAPNQNGDTDLTVDALADLGLGAPLVADVDVILDPVENLLGTDIDVDLDANLAGLTGGAGNLISGVVDGASGLLGGGGVLGSAPNQDGDTDLTVVAVADLGLGAPLVADVDVILDPVENLLGTDIDVDLDATLAGLTGGAGNLVPGVVDGASGLLGDGGLLGSAPNQTGDTDLTVDAVADLGLGAPLVADVDVILDPVENLLGTDIDVDLDANLAGLTDGAGNLVSGVVDGAGDLLGDGGLLGSAPNQDGDTDLTVDAVADLGLGAPLVADVDVILDPVETLVGTDIDVDLDANLAGVTSGAGNLVSGVVDGTGGLLGDGGLLGTAPNQTGDTDLTVDAVADLGLGAPLVADVDVVLDPAENLLGTDIDVDLDADLAGVTGGAGNLVSDVVDGAGGLLGDGGLLGSAPDQSGDTDLTVEAVADLGLGAPLVADVDVILDPVENLLNDGGLLGSAPDQSGDTDLTVEAVADLGLGAPLVADVDVILDPVENLLGTDIDVDLDANLAGVTSGAGNLVSGVVDGAGGLLGDGGLLGPAPNQTGDTDLTVDAVADLGLGTPLAANVDVILDPVENLLGTDIDVDLDANLAGLTNGAGNLVSGVVDGTGGLLGGGGLLGSAPNQSGDTDLTVDAVADLGLGTPLVADVDVILDPVENLLGTDIDVDLDAELAAATDGAGELVSGVVDGAGGLLGGIHGDGGLLSGGGLLGAAPDQNGDTDLTVDAVADLGLGSPIIGDVDVILDPVESLLGTDIDVDVDAIADVGSLLGGAEGLGSAGPIIDIGGQQTGDAPSSDTDLTLDVALLDSIVADADVNLDLIEGILGTDIDVNLDLGLDLGSFDTLLGGGDMSGGNLTLDQLLTLDTGSLSSGSLLGGGLEALTGSLSASSTTSTASSTTSSGSHSLFSHFGGGLFG